MKYRVRNCFETVGPYANKKYSKYESGTAPTY